MRYRVCITICMVLLLTTVSWTQKKAVKRTNIAILDFDARGGIDKGEAASLTDIFTGELINTQQFIVVDRNRLKEILSEQGFQQSEACSQVSCIVEVGKILKVEQMFAGTIGKIGKMYTVSVQLIDVATGEIISNKTRQHSGDIEELADILKTMADEVTGDITGVAIESGGGGSSWLWYVGGVALAGGGAAAYFYLQQNTKKTTPTPVTETPLPTMPTLPSLP